MNEKLTALFAAGFAVQQFLELLTAVLDLDSNPTFQKYKKVILGLCSLIAGLLLAYKYQNLLVLQTLGASSGGWLDICVTGFFLSAGTEGVNSIMKFAKYSKEDKKTTVAAKQSGSADLANASAHLAMQRLNRM